jgi:hypothetical protein
MTRKSIRDMQIAEFLNRDKNIASIVADAVRRGVSRFEPVVDPARREQLNMLDIQNVGEYINQFKIKLTDKLNGFDTAFNLPMDKPEFSSIIDKICNFISDMIDYNRIIQVYLNPSNTPQTRDAIMNKIEPLKSIFQKMLKNFERLVDDLLTKNEARLYSKFLIKIITNLCII